MKFQKGLAWFFLASLITNGIACAPRSPSTAENSISLEEGKTSDSIINGTTVTNNNPIARSVVAVYNDLTKSICSGSLLENNLVLTAAHCTTTDARFLFIIFETDITSSHPAKVQQYKMRQVIATESSPVWKRQEHLFRNQGDIGLLKFYGPVPYGYVPATLLTDFSILKKGVPIIIAGYGVNNAVTKTGNRILRQTQVILENPQFSDLEMSVDQSKGQGACSGDSGGPAFVYSNGRFYLWGVITRGYYNEEDLRRKKADEAKRAAEPEFTPEHFCNKQSIMTRVDVFRAWIVAATKAQTRLR